MFKQRCNTLEILDDHAVSGPALYENLQEIAFINRTLGGYAVILNALNKILEQKSAEELLNIADFACGSGDTCRAIAAWAHKKNIESKIYGLDINPAIIEYAKSQTNDFQNIHYETIDIFSDECKNKKYDIIICSLFCHHLTDEQIIQFIKQISQQTRVAVIINDLHRHWLAYYSIRVLTTLFSQSKLTRNDAPLSVLRAFKQQEFINYFAQAEIKHYSIKWCWAFRYQIILFKEPPTNTLYP